MPNVDWKYAATHLADNFYWFSELESIGRYASAAFDRKLDNYAPAFEKDQSYRAIYNFVITVANVQGLIDDRKVEIIYKFLEPLCDPEYVEYKKIGEILQKSGYINVVAEKFYSLTKKIADTGLPHKYSGRNLHPEVIKNSKKYFIDKDYFHAIKITCTAYNKKIQSLSGSTEDGTKLITDELGNNGRIKFNKFHTKSEKDEQIGIMQLSNGVIMAFRNPLAHETPETWEINVDDCLDILTLLSYLFKRLDNVKIN
jgi:uncharacterized protein (TIGR02391 family)